MEEKGEHLIFQVGALCLPYSSFNMPVIMPGSRKALSPENFKSSKTMG